MANAYTSTAAASLGGTAGSAGLVQKAYDKMVEFELRSEPMFRAIADKKPTNLTNPGDVVVMQEYQDLDLVTGTLDELVDPDSVSIATPTAKTLTLVERGNATISTHKLDKFAYANPEIAQLIARNMVDSLDKVYSNTLIAGTNVVYGGNATSTATVDAADVLDSTDIRRVVAKLRGASVSGRKGSYFWGGIHPDVSADLRSETGAAAWRDPHVYSDPQNIYAGEIGAYEGVFWVESPRLHVAADGASGAKVYRTLIAGKQALAESVAEEPHTILGPKTDKFNRFQPIGWYGILGHTIYRQEALWRIESGSAFA